MKIFKRYSILAAVMLLLFLPWQNTSMAKEWAFQSIHEVDKAWSVKFNLQLDGTSITPSSIYITDGHTTHPSVARLVGNGKEVQVIPTSSYEVGKSYRLMITAEVRSLDGKPLKTPIEVPFQVVDPTAAIQAIHSTISGMFTTFVVTTSPEVHKVTVNGQELTYIGGNQHTGTFIDMKPNSTVTVYGYGDSNKRLQTLRYTIQ